MKNIDLTPGEKEKVILALKRYRDFLSRVEAAVWEDDGARIMEYVFPADPDADPSPACRKNVYYVIGTLWKGVESLVEVELETDEGADEDA